MVKELENKERHGYTVLYDSASHSLVLGQMMGSMWPKVFPYCVVNVLITLAVGYIDSKSKNESSRINIRLSISDTNLSFLTALVAFVLVSRVKMAYSRYTAAISSLMVMYREASELVQKMVAFTCLMTDEGSNEWRNEVAYQTCILLRVAMGVVDYEEHYVNVWELDELDEEERMEIKKHIFIDTSTPGSTGMTNTLQWAHKGAIRSDIEENARVPMRMSYLLRKFIYTGRASLQEPMTSAQEGNLVNCVDAMMGGYYGIRQFKTTPFPFPLVQMTRTFVFLYVFLVPFALLSDKSDILFDCIIIFVLTFGIIGLEFVAIELTEPFGEDENDFDNLGMAYTTFEDIKCTILEVNGHEWTHCLHKRLNPPH